MRAAPAAAHRACGRAQSPPPWGRRPPRSSARHPTAASTASASSSGLACQRLVAGDLGQLEGVPRHQRGEADGTDREGRVVQRSARPRSARSTRPARPCSSNQRRRGRPARHGVVPAGAVVAARLPRVAQLDEAAGRPTAALEEEPQPALGPVDELARRASIPRRGQLGHRVAVHRRLGDGRRRRARPQSAACGNGPVAVAQVGHEPVVVLRRQRAAQLDDGRARRRGGPTRRRGSSCPTATATDRWWRWARRSRRSASVAPRRLEDPVAPRSASSATVGSVPPCRRSPSCRSGSGVTTGCRWWPPPGHGCSASLGWTVRTVAGEGPVDHLAARAGRRCADSRLPPAERRRGAGRRRPRGGGEPLHDPAEPTGGARRGRRACGAGPRCCTTTIRRGSERSGPTSPSCPPQRPGVAARHDQPPHRGADGRARHRGHDHLQRLRRRRAAGRPHAPPAPPSGWRTDERLLVHPVRAIERKGVPAALALAAALGATYWLVGPAEDGYEADAAHACSPRPRCRVIHRPVARDRWPTPTPPATPSPSRPPGRGSATRRSRRPSTGGPWRWAPTPWPTSCGPSGFRWFDPARPAELDAFLRRPDPSAPRPQRGAAPRQHLGLDRLSPTTSSGSSQAGWVAVSDGHPRVDPGARAPGPHRPLGRARAAHRLRAVPRRHRAVRARLRRRVRRRASGPTIVGCLVSARSCSRRPSCSATR